ncbi:MAG: hypothetical protein AMJ43_05570 [Coxiella sp. DG_40]|nr:MAG: hypothetical protein AMJ43_05570 [Coxiella sp. DG_40]
MNAVTRVVAQGPLVGSRITLIPFPLPRFKVLILIVMLLISAFVIVYVKDVNRRLFIDYQSLQQRNDSLKTNNEKLLLEKSAWSRQARIQVVAEQNFNMKVPSASNVIVVKL